MDASAKIYSPKQLQQTLASAARAEELSVVHGQDCVIVDTRNLSKPMDLALLPNCPMIALHTDSAPTPSNPILSHFDCVASEKELEQLLQCIHAQPVAASTLCHLLRQSHRAEIAQALTAESMAYSLLQSSTGFRTWLRTRSNKIQVAPETTVVELEREGSELHIVLNRPEKHNAYNEQMRDELSTALQLAVDDTSIQHVILRGQGASFSAGGDLTEFGAVNDAGIAHLTRTTRSPAFLLSRISERITVEVQGACIGAGIELPAFCARIYAREDAYFKLPEVALGLIPGAGGTVSITRRIGRQATAKLALTGITLNAQQALKMGLIDKLY